MNIKRTLQRWVFLSTIALVGVVSASIPATDNVIIFGDSLSDMGNNTWVKGLGYPNGAPITNKPTAEKKILWPNLLVAALRQQPANVNDPIVFSHKNDPLKNDVNYAYASAETGDNYLNDLSAQSYPPYVQCAHPGLVGKGASCVPGMITQIKLYLDQVNHQPNANTVFFLWAGGNDFFNDVSKVLSLAKGDQKAEVNGLSNLADSWQNQGLMPHSGMPAFSNPIKNIRSAVDLLVANHVSLDHIYVFNLPDMSQTPAAIALANGNKLILAAVRLLSGVYNLSLAGDLWADKFPMNHIYKINRLFSDIEHNKELEKDYHLTPSLLTKSCVDEEKSPPYNQICSGYAFYNSKHPTLEVEHVISDYFMKWENT